MLRNIGIISLFIYINLPLTFQNSDAIPVTGEESHKILREGEQEELGGNENILNIKEILERKKKGEVTFSISLDFTSAEYLGDGEYKKSLGMEEEFDDKVRKLEKEGFSFIGINTHPDITSTQQSCLLAAIMQPIYNIPMVPHIPIGAFDEFGFIELLSTLEEMGIYNIFLLLGERYNDPQYTSVTQALNFLTDYSNMFTIQVTGYPHLHRRSENFEKEIEYTKQKVDKGGDMIVTSAIFDPDVAMNFITACRKAGITVPIIPHLSPVSTPENLEELKKVRDVRIPQHFEQLLNNVKGDKAVFRRIMKDQFISIISRLIFNDIRHFEFDDRFETDFIIEIVHEIRDMLKTNPF